MRAPGSAQVHHPHRVAFVVGPRWPFESEAHAAVRALLDLAGPLEEELHPRRALGARVMNRSVVPPRGRALLGGEPTRSPGARAGTARAARPRIEVVRDLHGAPPTAPASAATVRGDVGRAGAARRGRERLEPREVALAAELDPCPPGNHCERSVPVLQSASSCRARDEPVAAAGGDQDALARITGPG